MDLEKYAGQVRQSPCGDTLEKLVRSGQGEKLLKKVDGEKLAAAAKAGDMQTLGQMINSILATPEGQSFAREVKKAGGQDGR